MELTWKDVEDKLEDLDFSITGRNTDDKNYSFEIQKYYDSSDQIFTLIGKKDEPASVVNALREIHDNFDIDYQTSIWIGEDGHGKNGAPYHISDIFESMKDVKNDLNTVRQIMEDYVKDASREYTKEGIGEFFLFNLKDWPSEDLEDSYSAMRVAGIVMKQTISGYPGTISKNKEMLSKYLKSIGFTEENPELCKNVINKALKERKLSKEKLNTVSKEMSDEDKNIHQLFDTLFNESETNPVDYASYVLSAGNEATLNGFKGDKWWKEACDHAANSGGELWQSSYERVELFEKFGLVAESPAEKKLLKDCYAKYLSYMKMYATPGDEVGFTEFKESIYTNKTDMTEYLQGNEKLLESYRNKEDLKDSKYEKLCETSDKKYGEYLFKYLKNLGVLDDKKRDQLIKKHEERNIGRG